MPVRPMATRPSPLLALAAAAVFAGCLGSSGTPIPTR